jgi:DNA invertase Pin-like site-specific DNA recombinase
MSGQRVGYIRVSTLDQHTERQLDGIQVDKTFTDKASGKDISASVSEMPGLPER